MPQMIKPGQKPPHHENSRIYIGLMPAVQCLMSERQFGKSRAVHSLGAGTGRHLLFDKTPAQQLEELVKIFLKGMHAGACTV